MTIVSHSVHESSSTSANSIIVMRQPVPSPNDDEQEDNHIKDDPSTSLLTPHSGMMSSSISRTRRRRRRRLDTTSTTTTTTGSTGTIRSTTRTNQFLFLQHDNLLVHHDQHYASPSSPPASWWCSLLQRQQSPKKSPASSARSSSGSTNTSSRHTTTLNSYNRQNSYANVHDQYYDDNTTNKSKNDHSTTTCIQPTKDDIDLQMIVWDDINHIVMKILYDPFTFVSHFWFLLSSTISFLVSYLFHMICFFLGYKNNNTTSSLTTTSTTTQSIHSISKRFVFLFYYWRFWDSILAMAALLDLVATLAADYYYNNHHQHSAHSTSIGSKLLHLVGQIVGEKQTKHNSRNNQHHHHHHGDGISSGYPNSSTTSSYSLSTSIVGWGGWFSFLPVVQWLAIHEIILGYMFSFLWFINSLLESYRYQSKIMIQQDQQQLLRMKTTSQPSSSPPSSSQLPAPPSRSSTTTTTTPTANTITNPTQWKEEQQQYYGDHSTTMISHNNHHNNKQIQFLFCRTILVQILLLPVGFYIMLYTHCQLSFHSIMENSLNHHIDHHHHQNHHPYTNQRQGNVHWTILFTKENILHTLLHPVYSSYNASKFHPKIVATTSLSASSSSTTTPSSNNISLYLAILKYIYVSIQHYMIQKGWSWMKIEIPKILLVIIRNPFRFHHRIRIGLQIVQWIQYIGPLLGIINLWKENAIVWIQSYQQRKLMIQKQKRIRSTLSQSMLLEYCARIIQTKYRSYSQQKKFKIIYQLWKQQQRIAVIRVQRALRASLQRARYRIQQKKREWMNLIQKAQENRNNNMNSSSSSTNSSNCFSLCDTDRCRMYMLQQEIEYYTKRYINQKLLLKPNSTFAFVWRSLFIVMISIEMIQLAIIHQPTTGGRTSTTLNNNNHRYHHYSNNNNSYQHQQLHKESWWNMNNRGKDTCLLDRYLIPQPVRELPECQIVETIPNKKDDMHLHWKHKWNQIIKWPIQWVVLLQEQQQIYQKANIAPRTTPLITNNPRHDLHPDHPTSTYWYCHPAYVQLQGLYIKMIELVLHGIPYTYWWWNSIRIIMYFMDVWITFFIGEYHPQTGCLQPHSFFHRYILPGLCFQLFINPGMEYITTHVLYHTIQWFMIRRGPIRIYCWFIALIYPLSKVVYNYGWKYVWLTLVHQQNQFVFQRK